MLNGGGYSGKGLRGLRRLADVEEGQDKANKDQKVKEAETDLPEVW